MTFYNDLDENHSIKLPTQIREEPDFRSLQATLNPVSGNASVKCAGQQRDERGFPRPFPIPCMLSTVC